MAAHMVEYDGVQCKFKLKLRLIKGFKFGRECHHEVTGGAPVEHPHDLAALVVDNGVLLLIPKHWNRVFACSVQTQSETCAKGWHCVLSRRSEGAINVHFVGTTVVNKLAKGRECHITTYNRKHTTHEQAT